MNSNVEFIGMGFGDHMANKLVLFLSFKANNACGD